MPWLVVFVVIILIIILVIILVIIAMSAKDVAVSLLGGTLTRSFSLSTFSA